MKFKNATIAKIMSFSYTVYFVLNPVIVKAKDFKKDNNLSLYGSYRIVQVSLCNNYTKYTAQREMQLVNDINQVNQYVQESNNSLSKISQEMENYSYKLDSFSNFLQHFTSWKRTVQTLEDIAVKAINEALFSPNPQPQLDAGASIELNGKISFDPSEFLNDTLGVFKTVTPSNVADWITKASTSIANTKLKISSEGATQVKNLSVELGELRNQCQTRSQGLVLAELSGNNSYEVRSNIIKMMKKIGISYYCITNASYDNKPIKVGNSTYSINLGVAYVISKNRIESTSSLWPKTFDGEVLASSHDYKSDGIAWKSRKYYGTTNYSAANDDFFKKNGLGIYDYLSQIKSMGTPYTIYCSF